MPWRRPSPKDPEPKPDARESLPEILTSLYLSRYTGRVVLILRGGRPSAIIRGGKATFIK